MKDKIWVTSICLIFLPWDLTPETIGEQTIRVQVGQRTTISLACALVTVKSMTNTFIIAMI